MRSSTRRRTASGLLTCVVVAGCGSAAEGPSLEGDRVGTPGAHEHGVARLALTVDGTEIQIRLDAPASVLYGFERIPRSEEEAQLVRTRSSALEAGLAEALTFSGSMSCQAGSVTLEGVPSVEFGDGNEEARDHDAVDHAHEDQDDHAHEDQDDEEAGEGHDEVAAEVTLTCSADPVGQEARLALQSVLPDLELVDLTILTPLGAASARVRDQVAFTF